MSAKLHCSREIIDTTIAHLHSGGARHCETVVLWLGTLRDGAAEVREVYRPDQAVDVDYFHISPEGMRSVMARIRATRFQILAQVHSHPGPAFHSKADDTWAIVRHVGAISVVVPNFASDVGVENFPHLSATYQLDDANHWTEVEFGDAVEII